MKRGMLLAIGFGTAVVFVGFAGAGLFAGGKTGEPVKGSASASSLESDFAKEIRPLVMRYCQECHSGKEPEAEIDYSIFNKLADVRKATKTWLKTREMLESRQMPPKKAKQPTDAERAKLVKWLGDHFKQEALAHAGDPGKVTLRRLSNSEYTYTIRDLFQVDTLNPAKEFPVDGAAGEGFTNTGDALSMSPALFTKYFDAGKKLARHAVFLPDGLRFSKHTTRRDWTNEILDRIRDIYGAYTDSEFNSKVALQGLVWDTKQGGRVPLEKYLEAALAEREALNKGSKTIEAIARDRGISSKYLGVVWRSLTDATPSLLLDPIRAKWRTASPKDAGPLAVELSAWQNAVWKFNSVGHLGKKGGASAWMEPIDPIVARQEIRFKLPATSQASMKFFMSALSTGQSASDDLVVWESPKLVAPGKAEVLLKDVHRLMAFLQETRTATLDRTDKYLAAIEDSLQTAQRPDLKALANKHGIDAGYLAAWIECLGMSAGAANITGHFTTKLNNPTYKFISGWGSDATPVIVANSSKEFVRIPGKMKGNSVAVHPSPKLNAAVGWQSPVNGKARVVARVSHAHPECGDGVSWAVELRRGSTRQRLAAGVAQGGAEPKIDPIDVNVRSGDVVALVIGPKSNHSCDLTATDLTISAGDKKWDLAVDVSSDIQQANPRADRFGNPRVWHYFTEPVSAAATAAFVVPKDSLLDQWRNAETSAKKTELATKVKELLTAKSDLKPGPDADLVKALRSLSGPLFASVRTVPPEAPAAKAPVSGVSIPFEFKDATPSGEKLPSGSVVVRAPASIAIELPTEIFSGYELASAGRLPANAGDSRAAQFQIGFAPLGEAPSIQPGVALVVADRSAAKTRLQSDLATFREVFPPAACYTKIVPVDEVVTLNLFVREDHRFIKLMLDEREAAKLNRLWDELHYVSHSAVNQVDAFNQLMEYATQDSDPRPFEHLRKPFLENAAAFRKRLVETEPKHLEGVQAFAEKAYRRPLTPADRDELKALYRKLRQQEVSHEDAIRLLIARVLASPTFLYRMETPPQSAASGPVSDLELASRLSYFLWSSAPDAELSKVASAGLRDPSVVKDQALRMLKDPKVRRLAIEFGCQWLHIRGFDESNEKSERHFPTFAKIKGDVYEESIRMFTDFFQNDRSVLDLLDGDYVIVNDAMADHYGIPGVKGSEWRMVKGVRKYGRGGILGLATTLSAQSGASRTSPILRGNWISEVMLGEKLPRPPKGVPQLPDDETKTEGLTVRQLVERHSSDPKCAICHKRIDAYGFSLEGFDAIGRRRDKDLSGRPIDVQAKTDDGAEFADIQGLRTYLLTKRRDAFVRQFCKKLLGYALGRGVQLSDEPLLEEMQEALRSRNYRVTVAIETIVQSRQFREIRGKAMVDPAE